MRDPKRIPGFCNRLARVWEQVPDWRFGQLMSNVLSEFQAQKHRDIFFPEDEEMISFFEEYMKLGGDQDG